MSQVTNAPAPNPMRYNVVHEYWDAHDNIALQCVFKKIHFRIDKDFEMRARNKGRKR
jgi:hypothetical protein